MLLTVEFSRYPVHPILILNADMVVAVDNDIRGGGSRQHVLFQGAEVMPYQLGRLVNWIVFSPERYALLAAMIGQSPRVTFSPKLIPDKIEEKLLWLSSQEVPLTKKEAAAQMGIKPHQLDSLLARYGMGPSGSTV